MDPEMKMNMRTSIINQRLRRLLLATLLSALVAGCGSGTVGSSGGSVDGGTLTGGAGSVGSAPQSIADPRNNFHPGHYIFVGENDGKYQFDLIKNNPDFVGVKKNYPWIKLETAYGVYDFSQIEADLKYLQSIGKRLWLQVNDTQFGPWNPLTPSYMWTDSKYGCDPASYGNYKRSVQDGGWLPCIWNDNVMGRITALYNALGARFNGEAYIEAITIGETSTGSTGWGYSPSAEQAAFKVRALAGKRAFPNKTVSHSVNYASFDLAPFVQWLAANGIGINHPDAIFAPWKGLVTDVFPFSIQYHADVPNAMDVSGFSYTEYNSAIGRANTSAELLSGVVQYTNPHYILWDITNPYFTNDAVPAIRNYGPLPAARDFYNSQK